MSRTSGLFWRAVFAFIAMPAVVALLIPWLLHPATVPFRPAALPILIVGVVLLLWCVRDFYVAGQGTLAPWEPPKHLVTIGLYQVSRNPMYLAVTVMLAAWAIGFGSITLWAYTAIVMTAFYLRVLTYEEPWLAKTFGAEWVDYRNRVSRWLGRRSSV